MVDRVLRALEAHPDLMEEVTNRLLRKRKRDFPIKTASRKASQSLAGTLTHQLPRTGIGPTGKAEILSIIVKGPARVKFRVAMTASGIDGFECIANGVVHWYPNANGLFMTTDLLSVTLEGGEHTLRLLVIGNPAGGFFGPGTLFLVSEICDCANPPPTPYAEGSWGVSMSCPFHST